MATNTMNTQVIQISAKHMTDGVLEQLKFAFVAVVCYFNPLNVMRANAYKLSGCFKGYLQIVVLFQLEKSLKNWML